MSDPTFPSAFPRARDMRVFLDGEPLEVLEVGVARFVCPVVEKPAELRIEADRALGGCKISPARHGLRAETDGDDRVARLEARPDRPLLVRFGGDHLPLFVYVQRPETPDRGATHFFAGGQTYEVGELRLESGESAYLERGAVVRGRITARHARGIRVAGQGVLDNSYYAARGVRRRSIEFLDCEDVSVEDILMVHPTTWMLVLAGCERVRVRGLRQLGERISSDGVDVVGSRDVHIADCFLRNNDDCLVVKHMNLWRDEPALAELLRPVDRVVAERCALFNAPAGNALEIGHELRCPEIRGVTFRDLDILRVDGHGAAFGIHAGDEAAVRGVRYENIRVEHYYEKLVDFRVMRSQFSRSPERGRIEDVTLENIDVTQRACNPGYSISVIGGYDADHLVDGVRFKGLRLDGVPVRNDTDLDLHVKHARNIVFEP